MSAKTADLSLPNYNVKVRHLEPVPMVKRLHNEPDYSTHWITNLSAIFAWEAFVTELNAKE